MGITGRSAALSAAKWVQRLLDLALILLILTPLALFFLQFPHSPKLDETWLVGIIRRLGDPVIAGAGSWLGIAWPSSSRSFLPLALAFALWLVKIAVDALFLQGHRLIARFIPAPQLAGSGSLQLGVVDSGVVSADSERAREELLKRYREIEQALKTAKRKRCTFLSLDVVGSTQMKVGERETDVGPTFQAYTEMLKKIFDQYGAWKVAWTPDGVMACFLQLDLAVGAAQRVLQGLRQFNDNENRLRTAFRVRCGLNEGEVPIFEDSKLEKVADRVIDVAGHMQKHGNVDSLWLSTEVYNLLADKSGFRPTEKTVDGYAVFEWPLESSLTPADAANR